MIDTLTEIRLPGNKGEGQVIALENWVSSKPPHSACDLGSGFTAQVIDLFQYVKGQFVPGVAPTPPTRRQATQRDTNLNNAGQMATTEACLVFAIKPEITNWGWDGTDFSSRTPLGATARPGMPMPSLTSLAVLGSYLVLVLEISEKRFKEASLAYFNTGYGPYGQGQLIPLTQGTAADGDSYNVATHGLPSEEAVNVFTIPDYIGGQEKFRVQLFNPGGLAVPLGATQALEPADVAGIMATIDVRLDGLYKRPVG